MLLISEHRVDGQTSSDSVYPLLDEVAGLSMKTQETFKADQKKAIHITSHLLNDEFYENIHRGLSKVRNYRFADNYETGYVKSFNVRNVLNQEQWYKIDAELLIHTDNIAIWMDTTQVNFFKNKGVLNNIRDTLIKNTDRKIDGGIDSKSQADIITILHKYFGDPPNIRQNGKVDILLLDIQDRFEETGSFVSGFFDPVNLIEHEYSNYRDMIYVDMYPTLYYEGSLNFDRTLSTIAHEYQHLIHANYEGDPPQSIFINEGLSELAEILCGFAPRNPEPHFRHPNRGLLSWNYSSPLPDYSRAAMWSYFMFEKIGYKYVEELVQTRRHGKQAIGYVLEQAGQFDFDELFYLWGKELFYNDADYYEALINEGETFNFADYSVDVLDQLPATANLELAPYSHISLSFPLTEKVDLQLGNAERDIPAIFLRTSYPGNHTEYSEIFYPFRLEANAYPYGDMDVMFSRSGTANPEADSVNQDLEIFIKGKKSGVIKELKYDDGNPDPFHRNASYLLLDDTEKGVAVIFGPEETDLIHSVKLNMLFLSEIEGSGVSGDVPRTYHLKLAEYTNGEIGSTILDAGVVESNRPHGNLRAESFSLESFHDQLSDVQDSVAVVIRSDNGHDNFVAIGMDSTANQTYSYYSEERAEEKWKSFTNFRAGETNMEGWNAMVRLVVRRKESRSPTALISDISHDFHRVLVEVEYPNEKGDWQLSAWTSMGDQIYAEGPAKDTTFNSVVFTFPAKVDADYHVIAVAEKLNSGEVREDQISWSFPVDEEIEPGHAYPNPFNHTTNIPVIVWESTELTMQVYDILGRRVKNRDVGQLDPGRHNISLALENLASGTYLIRFKGRDGPNQNFYSEVRKVTLIK